LLRRIEGSNCTLRLLVSISTTRCPIPAAWYKANDEERINSTNSSPKPSASLLPTFRFLT